MKAVDSKSVRPNAALQRTAMQMKCPLAGERLQSAHERFLARVPRGRRAVTELVS